MELGLSRNQIEYRTTTGAFVIVDHAVYRVSGTPPSRQQLLMAACLAGPAVVSHRSAGLIWSFPAMSDEIVEVTALRHRRRRSTAVTWHESFHLSTREVTEVDGLPVTRPTRTFLDLGVVLSADELELVLNDGIRRRLLSVEAISRRLEQFSAVRPGAAVVRAVLDRHIPGGPAPESVLETRFVQLLRAGELPAPTAQLEISLGNGAKARVDFAYPSHRIAFELDGAAYHSGPLAQRRDRQRDNRLGAMGWRVVHFDWDDVTRRSEYVLETVNACMTRNNSG
jgi:very-short-patch-repair endonuclease